MENVIPWKRNDSGTKTLTLTDGDGELVNLVGATIKLLVRRAADDLLEIAATGDAEGLVTYDYSAADSAVGGFFKCEVEVTFGGGGVQTFPEDGSLWLKVSDDLNP
jgi:hypothetical protein